MTDVLNLDDYRIRLRYIHDCGPLTFYLVLSMRMVTSATVRPRNAAPRPPAPVPSAGRAGENGDSDPATLVENCEDLTRRGILERLGRGDASISDLAARFDMTLTGVKKHVLVLEEAGLVTTEKVGRVRTCRLGPRRLEDESAWITMYRRILEARLDRLGEFLERTKGKSS